MIFDPKAERVFGDNNWILRLSRVEPLGLAVKRKYFPSGGSFAFEPVQVSSQMCACGA